MNSLSATSKWGHIGQSLYECFARASAILCLLYYNISGLQAIKTKRLSLEAEQVPIFQHAVQSYEVYDKTVADVNVTLKI